MTLREALVAVRELLADESRWTKGVYARTKWGTPIDSQNPYAVRWCVAGAATKICGDNPLRYVVQGTFCAGAPDSIVVINDRSTHAEVLARLDAAIERCKDH